MRGAQAAGGGGDIPSRPAPLGGLALGHAPAAEPIAGGRGARPAANGTRGPKGVPGNSGGAVEPKVIQNGHESDANEIFGDGFEYKEG